ncbi:MAG: hypothetical protein ABIG60_00170 [Patescibacteria group bacterium]
MEKTKVKIKTSWLKYWLGHFGICPGKTPEGMDFMIWINECLKGRKELFLCLTNMQLFCYFSSLALMLIKILEKQKITCCIIIKNDYYDDLLNLFKGSKKSELKGELYLISTFVEFDQCAVSGNDVFILNSFFDNDGNLQLKGNVRQNNWYFSQAFRFKLQNEILPHCFYK